MSKDLLIDNSIAKDFCNPMKFSYKELIQWLFDEGELVVTQKLICEYHSSTAGSAAPTNIIAIIAHLIAKGRLIRFNKKTLDDFKFSNKIEKKLRSNHEDWPNIKAILLSHRKMALSLDNNFIYDVCNFPGYITRVEKRPEDLPYK